MEASAASGPAAVGGPRAGRLSRVASSYGGFVPVALLLGAFFLIPLGLIVLYSFWKVENYNITHQWTLENYRGIFNTSEAASTIMPARRFLCSTTRILLPR